jgi:hypothetical protein
MITGHVETMLNEVVADKLVLDSTVVNETEIVGEEGSIVVCVEIESKARKRQNIADDGGEGNNFQANGVNGRDNELFLITVDYLYYS